MSKQAGTSAVPRFCNNAADAAVAKGVAQNVSPLTEDEFVQSGNFAFSATNCSGSHCISPTCPQPVHSLYQGRWQEFAPPPAFLTLTWTADCISPLLVFCLSHFDLLNECFE